MKQLYFGQRHLNKWNHWLYLLFALFLVSCNFLHNSLRRKYHLEIISQHIIYLNVLDCKINLSVHLLFVRSFNFSQIRSLLSFFLLFLFFFFFQLCILFPNSQLRSHFIKRNVNQFFRFVINQWNSDTCYLSLKLHFASLHLLLYNQILQKFTYRRSFGSEFILRSFFFYF